MHVVTIISKAMRTLADLSADIEREARHAPFPVDVDVYRRAERDETFLIYRGCARPAPVCVFGRDLGKDEVAAGQPLIGAGRSIRPCGIVSRTTWCRAAEVRPKTRVHSGDALLTTPFSTSRRATRRTQRP